MNRFRPIALFLTALAPLLLLSACGEDSIDAGGDGTGAEPTPSTAAQDGGSAAGGTSVSLAGGWRLVSFELDGEMVALPAGRELTITIEGGEITGEGGCNTFGGTLDRGDLGALQIGDLFATEMACEHLNFENLYLGALAEATGWTADPQGITFTGSTFAAVYQPLPSPEPAPLIGTAWLFDTVYAGAGVERSASTTEMSAPEVVVVLDGESITFTSGACPELRLAASYVEGTGEAFSLDGPPPAVACPDSSESETVNLDTAVSGVAIASGYTINDQRLIFIGEAGETVGFIAVD